MNKIKKIYLVLLIAGFFIPYNNAQQQVHIHWPSLADSPWPVLRGDMQGTGRSRFIGPSTKNVIWRIDMPLGIFHGPVVGYNDDLFFGTRAVLWEGFNYFYSLDKHGRNIWTYITEGGRANISGPTIANDGTIYFSSLGISSGVGGGLYALNPDGTLKWVNDRFVYTFFTRHISVGKNGYLYLPRFDYLYVLEPENGNIIDSLYLPDISGTEVVFSVGGDTIFYISGRLHTQDPKAINAATINGEHLWSVELYDYNWGTPVVDNNNRVYVYGNEDYANAFLYCINPDGTINWKYKLDADERYENYSSPTIDGNGNIIFQSSSPDSGYINSLDYNGNLNWKTTLGHFDEDGAFINHGLVSDAEGKIYCGSSLGLTTNFWCLNSNGKILWKLDLEGYEFDTSPAIGSDGTIYIGTHLDGLFQNHVRNLIAIRDTGTVSVNEDNVEIKDYSLSQNYPNPFNPSTTIKYQLANSGIVTLKVYDILGKEITILENKFKPKGSYKINFSANNLSSGVYIYRITASNNGRILFTDSKQMILLR
jgi:outer membrane protein assembly factor BamB